MNTFLKIIWLSLSLLLVSYNCFAKDKKIEYKIPETLLQQVEQGNAESAYFIADMFLNGSEYVKSDQKKAMEWLKKAANMGNPHAILAYADELNYASQYQDALKYYQQAAENGMGKGFEMIGNYYLEGKANLPKNCHKAYEQYEKAELREYKSAFNNHAWSLATSKDSSCRNPERALRIFYKMLAIYGDDFIPSYIMDTKAAVLAAVSDFGQAIKIQQKIIDDLKEMDVKVNPEYIKHLEAYKKRQVWIEEEH